MIVGARLDRAHGMYATRTARPHISRLNIWGCGSPSASFAPNPRSNLDACAMSRRFGTSQHGPEPSTIREK
jgi:hypothetical protein